MNAIAGRLLALALFVPGVLGAPAALGQNRGQVGATSVEIARLPKFCWAQMGVPGATGGEFTFQECGPWINHYCEGLIHLQRAKSEPDSRKRATLLVHADTAIRYTENGIRDYPRCSATAHVAATKAEVNTLLTVYGNKNAPPRPR